NHPPGCPAFGPDNCVRPGGVLRPKGSVTPGQHQPEAGEHHVVWWDPCLLELGKQEDVGSRLNKLIAADEEGTRSQAGILAHGEWQASRASVREESSAPSLRVVTATEYSLGVAATADASLRPGALADAIEPQVTVESVVLDFSRPHGKRFGILVHAVLSVVDLDADRVGVEAVAELQGRVLNATREEVAAASETVARALGHPLLKKASAAAARGSLHRETPIAIELEDGLLVEGVVDLAFIDESGSWTVVDFKTDFEIEGRIDEYRNQVALYAKAITVASGLPSRGALLRL
ncbi:MAG TPA: PD-(D/E)XK nuclease family protein, partial [Blastocatellia bacterium]|nr:PD-(D/E)XK nuclease family protein [Blastocatellia bacterium]